LENWQGIKTTAVETASHLTKLKMASEQRPVTAPSSSRKAVKIIQW
jgi:hypothetical protein